jgi:DNA-binding FadR family transcriptional regulator
MEREVAAQEKRPNDQQNMIRHDYLFHELILQAAGNSVLLNLAKSLAPLLVRSRKLTGMASPDLSRSIHQHRAILEAIRRRDPEMAEHAMRSHLQSTGLDLITQAKPAKRA